MPGEIQNVMAQLEGCERELGMTGRYDTAPERFRYLLAALQCPGDLTLLHSLALRIVGSLPHPSSAIAAGVATG